MRPRFAILLVGILICATLVRVARLGEQEFWLDELHSLHLAWGEDLADVIERGREDMHPPLFFFLLHALKGVGVHSLRWVPILASLATLLPLWGLLRESKLSAPAGLAGFGFFCLLPFQINYGAELRSYSVLQLAAVCVTWAAFTRSAGGRTRAAV